MEENWFLFRAQAYFRFSPGPGWQWPARPPGTVGDRPTPGWPTAEYLAMQAALEAALTRDAPTLMYRDPMWGYQLSLVVRRVAGEIPLQADESGTGTAPGVVEFETSCFGSGPYSDSGPGAKLGEWLSWVDFTYEGGSAGVQLLSLDLMSADSLTPPAEGGESGMSTCQPFGGRLFVR